VIPVSLPFNGTKLRSSRMLTLYLKEKRVFKRMGMENKRRMDMKENGKMGF